MGDLKIQITKNYKLKVYNSLRMSSQTKQKNRPRAIRIKLNIKQSLKTMKIKIKIFIAQSKNNP